MANIVTIIGLEKIGLMKAGDDVARKIFESLEAEHLRLLDGDVVVVSQKIVSKAEGLEVDISTVKPSAKARNISLRTKKDARLIELILKDSKKVLRADRLALVVQTRSGMVCLNAGVDKSNVKGRFGHARLPVNPDESAGNIRRKLEALTGRLLAVIVADTYSRPFRVGQVEFAIGISGMDPIIDYRGQEDLYGYTLKFKFVGLADEVAAAAELVMGQGTERTPVAIVRGLPRLKRTEDSGLSRKLVVGKRLDIFHEIL